MRDISLSRPVSRAALTGMFCIWSCCAASAESAASAAIHDGSSGAPRSTNGGETAQVSAEDQLVALPGEDAAGVLTVIGDRACRLSVDDRSLGDLRAGEERSFPVAVGEHWLQCDPDGEANSDVPFRVNVSESGGVVITVPNVLPDGTQTTQSGNKLLRTTRAARPHYPESLFDQGVEGVVWIRMLVHCNGSPIKVEIEKSSGHLEFDESALATAREFIFLTALPDREGDCGWALFPMDFRLSEN